MLDFAAERRKQHHHIDTNKKVGHEPYNVLQSIPHGRNQQESSHT